MRFLYVQIILFGCLWLTQFLLVLGFNSFFVQREQIPSRNFRGPHTNIFCGIAKLRLISNKWEKETMNWIGATPGATYVNLLKFHWKSRTICIDSIRIHQRPIQPKNYMCAMRNPTQLRRLRLIILPFLLFILHIKKKQSYVNKTVMHFFVPNARCLRQIFFTHFFAHYIHIYFGYIVIRPSKILKPIWKKCSCSP